MLSTLATAKTIAIPAGRRRYPNSIGRSAWCLRTYGWRWATWGCTLGGDSLNVRFMQTPRDLTDADSAAIKAELADPHRGVLSTRAAAWYCGLSEAALKASDCPRKRVGRRVLWPRRVVDDWLRHDNTST